MFTIVLSRITMNCATPSTARIHQRIAWLAAWSVVSATSSGEVPGGLTDSSLDWDNVTPPLARALTLTHDETATGRKTVPLSIPDPVRLVPEAPAEEASQAARSGEGARRHEATGSDQAKDAPGSSAYACELIGQNQASWGQFR